MATGAAGDRLFRGMRVRWVPIRLGHGDQATAVPPQLQLRPAQVTRPLPARIATMRPRVIPDSAYLERGFPGVAGLVGRARLAVFFPRSDRNPYSKDAYVRTIYLV
ncbi:hypothetical protein Acr_01g0006050 [Actinidia rufa]|uniref:Uncharacterized protein n=1 Tax=Actinidia rufa TaxID=165716 RepID=A0A7J0E3S3_9ERIC|nr:hypothetical protein Acr_01g0006050 [Actinidia rufa]